MVRTARRRLERIMSVAACACVGGFVASALGQYLGTFTHLDLAGAVALSAVAAWIEFR